MALVPRLTINNWDVSFTQCRYWTLRLPDNSSGVHHLAYLTPWESELHSIGTVIGRPTSARYTKTRAFPFTAAFHEKEGPAFWFAVGTTQHDFRRRSQYPVEVQVLPPCPSRFLRSPYGARSIECNPHYLVFRPLN